MVDASWGHYTKAKEARHRSQTLHWSHLYERSTTERATGQKTLSGTKMGGGSHVVRWEQSVLSGRWECSRARWRWRSYNTVNALHTTACLKMANMYFITIKKKRYHKISKHLKQGIILLGLWRRERQPTPVFLSGELHGQRTQVGYTVQGVAKSRTWLSE